MRQESPANNVEIAADVDEAQDVEWFRLRASACPTGTMDHETQTDNPDPTANAHVDAQQSPFHKWLDNATIGDLVLRSLVLPPGDMLVRINGLVPALVAGFRIVELDAFLEEISVKAHRLQGAVDHPGEGRACRVTPGEELGGPTSAGHEHLTMARDSDRHGTRKAERAIEGEFWAHASHLSRRDADTQDMNLTPRAW